MQRAPKIEEVEYIRNIEDDEITGARSDEYARDVSVKQKLDVIHNALRTRTRKAICAGAVAVAIFLIIVAAGIVATVLVANEEKEKLNGMVEDKLITYAKRNDLHMYAKKDELTNYAKKGKH